MSHSTKELTLEKNRFIPEIFGTQDNHLKLIEKKFQVRITTRENHIKISGDKEAIEKAENLLHQLHDLIASGNPIFNGDVKYAIRLFAEDEAINLNSLMAERIAVSPQKGFITPKGSTQLEFVEAIRTHDIILGIGPAGTGKTYLAVALAVEGLLKNQFQRIVLVRPAVEAGESLGFLPGDISEKIHPYLMPLYDALKDMLLPNRMRHMIQDGIIEIAPLAYMRGRTLNNSFIILDEAQNSTQEQMKMFLTRLGPNSKMVVTGDITQVDLPQSQNSGLIQVQKILNKIESIRFIYFSDKDVVRHDLVKKIVTAYDKKSSKP
ncbi:MAG: PhoH family protein [Nitrospinota bacterium]|nr:PhoH family protein [Nitrospinota bacterium]